MRLYRGQRIAQMLSDRQATFQHLSIIDRAAWYLPKESLLIELLLSTFHLSFLDQDTQDFLDTSIATSNSYCLQAYYSFMSSLLSYFITKTSINGVLNRGGMFLFSESQLRDFLMIPVEWSNKDKKVLDLGAGDGGITIQFSKIYEKIYTTEMSQVMQWRLSQKGFNIVDANSWMDGNSTYDLISVLNLLDRHYNPRALLTDLHRVALRSNCSVMMAVVLPARQYVEFHPSRKTTNADVSLKVNGSSFEEHAASLVINEFVPAGFELIRWTKLPYLCEGDFNRPFYLLSDAVFLLRAIPISDVYSTTTVVTEISNDEL